MIYIVNGKYFQIKALDGIVWWSLVFNTLCMQNVKSALNKVTSTIVVKLLLLEETVWILTGIRGYNLHKEQNDSPCNQHICTWIITGTVYILYHLKFLINSRGANAQETNQLKGLWLVIHVVTGPSGVRLRE